MAIDIRASVSCSLGEDLVSATINDDYVQGNGLVKVSGSAEIVGVVAPAPGTPVTFTYTTPAGVTRTVPRNLLVLSSFANPYTKTTQVELGCALTYLQDLREEINWAALDDPENTDATCDDVRIVTLPIHASSIFEQCLTKLGLTATQNPLTNKFSIAEFDFSAGYVQIISDLLVSENYCGFINAAGQLEVFSLDQTGGSGPVIDQTRIIELGPVGVGGVPAETVVVNYSTLKLQLPEGEEVDPDALSEEEKKQKLWEYQKIVDSPVGIPTRTSGILALPYTFFYSPWTEIETEYANIGGSDYVVKEIRTSYSVLAREASSYFEQLEQAGVVLPPYSEIDECVTKVVVTTEYATAKKIYSAGSTDEASNACVLPGQLNDEVSLEEEITSQTTTTIEYEPFIRAACGCNVPLAFDNGNYVYLPDDLIPVRKTVETREFGGDIENVVTSDYCCWHLTVQGQQGIAEQKPNFTTAAEVESYLDSALGTLALNNVRSQKGRSGYRVTPGRPAAGQLNAGAYAKGGDPNNGYRTESKAEIELAMGSPSALRRLELSLPYAPDDVFTKTGTTFTATASDAEAKARAYGRVQNMLLMANRSGISVQTAADLLPPKPFSPIVISAAGVFGVYRTNGTGWVMDGNGIVMSTDALFMGGAGASVGATGDTFFPTAPTITTLPTAPAVVDTTPDQLLAPIASAVDPQLTLNTAYPAAITGDAVQDENTGLFWQYTGTTWVSVGMTAPETVLGTINSVEDSQLVLNTSYPEAVAGDGVQAEDTDEFWVLQSNGTWLNVGTNPGPTMTVPTTVPLWNETVNAIGRTRTTLQVASFNYPLQRLTQVAVTTMTKVEHTRTLKISVPVSPEVTVMDAPAPRVEFSVDVRVGSSDTLMEALVPVVGQLVGTYVEVPSSTCTVTAYVPNVPASQWHMRPAAVDIAMGAPVPQVGGGVGFSLQVPAAVTTVAAPVPVVPGASWHMRPPAADIAVAAPAPTAP